QWQWQWQWQWQHYTANPRPARLQHHQLITAVTAALLHLQTRQQMAAEQTLTNL
ncbi:hypothetical protein HMPREF3204_01113, partial [Gardnerella pickettii]